VNPILIRTKKVALRDSSTRKRVGCLMLRITHRCNIDLRKERVSNFGFVIWTGTKPYSFAICLPLSHGSWSPDFSQHVHINPVGYSS